MLTNDGYFRQLVGWTMKSLVKDDASLFARSMGDYLQLYKDKLD